MRVFWPVTLAAALLVGLLAYGVVSKGADTTLDEAVRQGRAARGARGALPRLGGDGNGRSPTTRARSSCSTSGRRGANRAARRCRCCRRPTSRSQPQGGDVLGVDTQDATGKAIGFLKRSSATFPSLRDRDRDYGREFGVTGYPETFIIDRRAGSRRCSASRSTRRGWTSTCRSCWRRGVKPYSSRSLAALAFAAPAAAQKASLPDIEDEVMCVECGTVLSVSNSPVATQERAVHPRADRRGQEQGRRSRPRS